MPGPQGVAHLNITAGTLVAVGGIMGYTRKKSLPSLVAGVLLGAAYYGSAYLVDRVDPVKGFQAGAATSAFLTAAMLPRYLKTKAFMPAGLCALIGVGAGAYNGWQLARYTAN
ncbi:unnamed protein product [Amoebophrya sp. A120]|nr:unnamed protein product [Amoebophrya sp. A120]|eukprot:GSA120T00024322001.1